MIFNFTLQRIYLYFHVTWIVSLYCFRESSIIGIQVMTHTRREFIVSPCSTISIAPFPLFVCARSAFITCFVLLTHLCLLPSTIFFSKMEIRKVRKFCHTLPKPKMCPFNPPYLTQNYNSTYVEISSGKTYRSNQWRHLMLVKWKYTVHEKIGVKVDRFLKLSRRFQI